MIFSIPFRHPMALSQGFRQMYSRLTFMLRCRYGLMKYAHLPIRPVHSPQLVVNPCIVELIGSTHSIMSESSLRGLNPWYSGIDWFKLMLQT